MPEVPILVKYIITEKAVKKVPVKDSFWT